ncbi:spore germination protein [Tumebacillus avium]|nr:spore germination protein [Tumebacillus avium]
MENLADYKKESIRLFGVGVELIYIETLVDANKTKQQLLAWSEEAVLPDEDAFAVGSLLLERIDGQLVNGEPVDPLLAGQAFLSFPDWTQRVQFTPQTKQLDRSLSESQTQSVVRGTQVAFTEALDTNIGLLRKQLPSPKLAYRTITLGTDTKRKAGLLYLEGNADPKLVADVWQALEQRKSKDHPTTQSIFHTLQQKWWNPFPTIFSTDVPQEAARMLREGRVLLIVDQFPSALITPGVLQDAFYLAEDRGYPNIITHFLRLLRILAMFIALTAPALYVGLIAVNPEVLRIQLALSIAQSREGVPYPALVEVLLMLLVIELVLEASVRLPKSIGPTVTMVGGIVLGQAVVQAHLVSNLLIIVISAMTLANFSIIGFQTSLAVRIFKYALLVITSIYGLIGLFIGLVWVIAFISGLTTFGVPYLSRWKEQQEGSHG